MGTFQGHLLPGLFFLAFAIWWTTQIAKRHVMCKQRRRDYFATASFTCFYGKWRKYPIEGIFKVLMTGIGMAAELFAAFDYGHSKTIVSMGDLQHVTMYLFFFLAAVSDILMRKTKLLPYGADYIMFAGAFTIEGLLFKYHLHGRNDLDVLLHSLMLYVIFTCAICCLLEMKYNNYILSSLARTYFVFLQVIFI